MDIEERAERWAADYEDENDLSDFGPGIRERLVIAYLAGSAQTQADYVQHYESRDLRPGLGGIGPQAGALAGSGSAWPVHHCSVEAAMHGPLHVPMQVR